VLTRERPYLVRSMAPLAEARRPRRRATEHGTGEMPPVLSMIACFSR